MSETRGEVGWMDKPDGEVLGLKTHCVRFRDFVGLKKEKGFFGIVFLIRTSSGAPGLDYEESKWGGYME